MTRILYIVNGRSGQNLTTLRLLSEAAEKRGISTVVLQANEVNITQMPHFSEGDLLYTTSVQEAPQTLFKLIASTHPVTTVYRSIESLILDGDNVSKATLLHQAKGLPVNKTVFHITRDRQTLQDYVAHLGGYPVIIKSVGGSHGVGVMRFDSAPSLFAGIDFLIGSKGQFVMRQYIEHDAHARIIVLGGEVIDSIEYRKTSDDFRTNVGTAPLVEVKKFDESIEQLAIDAVHALGSDFGGVDIMLDKEGKPHIAEVNNPCFFPRAQKLSGIDIAGKIIDFLIEKSAKG